MIRSACGVEKTAFFSQESHFTTLPQRIWKRKDILLFAAGSLPCVRTLYFRAIADDALQQLVICPISQREYAAGSYLHKLAVRLSQALDRTGLSAVIFYASCAELLTGCDFDLLLKEVDNPQGIPIHILRRGPLNARTRSPGSDLDKILAAIPETGRSLDKMSLELPPPPPDFSGIASLLQGWDIYPFLLTPGGCTGCISLADGMGEDFFLERSRFTDMELAVGGESLAVEGIAAGFAEAGRNLCCIMGSPIPALIGMDTDFIVQKLAVKGVPALYLPCSGYEAAQTGITKALLRLGKELLPLENRQERKINVLGWSPLAFAGKEVLQEAVAFLRNQGFKVAFWGQGSLEEAKKGGEACLNWVVAAEGIGLARWMKQELAIPYFEGLPLGQAGMNHWQQKIAALLGFPFQDKAFLEPPDSRQERVLLLGQPLVLRALHSFLTTELGFSRISMGLYAPTADLCRLFSPYTDEGMFLFADPSALLEGGEGPRMILSDPLLFPVLSQLFPAAGLYPLYDPMLSGRWIIQEKLLTFDEKGGEFIRQLLFSQ